MNLNIYTNIIVIVNESDNNFLLHTYTKYNCLNIIKVDIKLQLILFNVRVFLAIMDFKVGILSKYF